MALLPELEDYVAAVRATNGNTPQPDPSDAGRRRAEIHAMYDVMYNVFADSGPELPVVEDLVNGTVVIRRYQPAGDGPFPIHLYFHGGGGWLGTLEWGDAYCRTIAAGAGCLVLSVDYRLGPEFPFPAGFDDCYAAVEWAIDNAIRLQGDPQRVTIGGASAGGNLAAAVALASRDRSGPPILGQVLEIPVTDATMSMPSTDSQCELSGETRLSMWTHRVFYCPDETLRATPYVSPLFADSVADLPPALLLIAELDPRREEAERYAARLTEAGVANEVIIADGHVHGSMSLTKLVPSAIQYTDATISWLRKVHRSTP